MEMLLWVLLKQGRVHRLDDLERTVSVMLLMNDCKALSWAELGWTVELVFGYLMGLDLRGGGVFERGVVEL